MKISICIPVYNGARTIERLVEAVDRELAGQDIEFVLVNDGSKDDSESVCERLARSRTNMRFISLRKNFGEHNAVMCALNHITGDCAVIIDDDFQNPPEEIIKLVEELEKGYDVVYSRFESKRDSIFRNLGSKFNDMTCTWLLNKPVNLYLSSFKAIRREVVEEIITYQGPFPYVDGLILRVTSNISTVRVRHDKREEGRSNYTLKKLISLWLNMFINFSIKPLRVFTVMGLGISLISLLLIIYFILEKLLRPETSQGWASIMVAITFFSGIQLLFLGLISEYLGKHYMTTNKAPQWTIKKNLP
ncbi:glycosyltransferase family 2 protein [Desulfonatronum sp. SC1]|uniref:glycosyltransferase family 2 protein n=1 Tax=Desulfonatronum sp. SC1 TaxID=2109626 RepID=UPI000D3065C9|nr:glycosyltransferase family 2 protein [Desulfonatronum sp. SC1]PTN36495.1 glycosyltransferase [Desulfonatronum sp. SC1]